MSKVNDFDNIAAIVLAAGNSSRMGRPKLSLPWGNTTVLGRVVATFSEAGIKDIIVVTGGAQGIDRGIGICPGEGIYQSAPYIIRITWMAAC